MQNLPILNSLDVKGKVVLVRTSYDVPIDNSKSLLDPNRVRDDSRIRDTIATFSYLIKNNAKIILEPGWLGRPKGEDKDLSMAPCALKLQELLKENGILKHPVLLTPNSLDGSAPRSAYRNKDEVLGDVEKIKEGQIIMLENVRYDAEANADDQEFAKFIASLAGDGAIYVNEAEAQNHRPEATITSVPKYIRKNGGKTVFGFKVAEVIKYIGNISSLLQKKERGSFVFFLSGKKIETQVGITSKISVTHSLLNKMRKDDVLVVQGAVTYTFLIAEKYIGIIEENKKKIESIIDEYNKKIATETKNIEKGKKDASQIITDLQAKLQKEKSNDILNALNINEQEIKKLIGNSFVEWKEIGEQIAFAARVIFKAKERGVIVVLNKDHVITNKYPDKFGNLPTDAAIADFDNEFGIPNGWLGVAPGQKTMDIISKHLDSAYLVILAGPISIEDRRLENFSRSNEKLLSSLKKAKIKGAITIAAGGDSVAMVKSMKGENAFTVLSNAGGATLELIEKDGKLPGIEAVLGN